MKTNKLSVAAILGILFLSGNLMAAGSSNENSAMDALSGTHSSEHHMDPMGVLNGDLSMDGQHGDTDSHDSQDGGMDSGEHGGDSGGGDSGGGDGGDGGGDGGGGDGGGGDGGND
ncbi:hypothetical protein [Nitratifractor sp.]|uniref:hypothetical protein n=1 Tax=Nitratifractor sp. TaxID=2268144 RepID=UPI0025CC155E|nr:hypothetical protein [Nitratifractor sp.]